MNPSEKLDTIVGLCSKVAVNAEIDRVHMDDLKELRNHINDLAKHISIYGYKTIPKIVRNDVDTEFKQKDNYLKRKQKNI